MSAAVRLVHFNFLLVTYVKEILSQSTNTDAGKMIKRNTSSIGAWPNSLDRRLLKYCIVSPLFEKKNFIARKRMNVLRYPSCFFVYWKRATFYFQYNWNFLNVLSGRAIVGPCQTHVIGQALSKFRHYDILLDVLYRFHRRTRKKNETQQILYFLSSTVLMYVVFITIKANRTFLSGWFGGGCFFYLWGETIFSFFS